MISDHGGKWSSITQFTGHPENEGDMNFELFRGFLPIGNIFLKKGEL